MSLLTSMREFFSRYGVDKTYWIAFSGGLDSHVLLDLCCRLRAELSLQLQVIHINHGLSANAAVWGQHCKEICAAYGVPYHNKTLQIHLEAGDSLEEIAREQRYAAFIDYMLAGEVLLTAHHQDDQAETLLLQLFRGAGVQGLAAMPSSQIFASGWHARPLLSVSRQTLQEYAVSQPLKWIEDESNKNIKLTRNFLRLEILPLLQARWPSVTVAIARSAEHCASAQSVLDDYVGQLLAQAQGSQLGTLSIELLLQLDTDRQRLVLRAWIQQSGHPLPDTKKLNTICQSVLKAGVDRQPAVEWQQTVVRRHRDDLFVLPLFEEVPAEQVIVWDLQTELNVVGVGRLVCKDMIGAGIRADVGPVTVRWRTGGESVCLPGGHRTLKNLFQEWGVPTWLRDRIPLLYAGEKLIAVVGYFIDAEVRAGDGESGVVIDICP